MIYGAHQLFILLLLGQAVILILVMNIIIMVLAFQMVNRKRFLFVQVHVLKHVSVLPLVILMLMEDLMCLI